MKKLSNFWGKRKMDKFHSHSSDLPMNMAGTTSSLSTGRGHHREEKHTKKLHKAASDGNVEKLKVYLEHKKHDVNGQDKKNRTPLHLACANGYADIVCLLFEHQCKVNVQDDKNKTPLMKAVECQQENCATVLLQNGADPNLVDFYGNTALHYAACGKNISIANKLLEYKANLEAKNKDGYTPFLLAVAADNENMLEFLEEKGADVNASDNKYRTAIMIAITAEPTSSVKLLHQRAKGVSRKDIYGLTIEDYASLSVLTKFHQKGDNNGNKKNMQSMLTG